MINQLIAKIIYLQFIHYLTRALICFINAAILPLLLIIKAKTSIKFTKAYTIYMRYVVVFTTPSRYDVIF